MADKKKQEEQGPEYLYFLKTYYYPGDNQPGLLYQDFPLSKEQYEEVCEQLRAGKTNVVIHTEGEREEGVTCVYGQSRNLHSLYAYKQKQSNVIVNPNANQIVDAYGEKYKGLKPN